ncbi:MAG: hypothetical protein LBG52_01895 [Candidatus Peribacteria bacterium]|nr:hypothetical protein [Candidatus Peribacteria bacterium]
MENINQEAFQQTLEKLSVIMKNYDKLPPTEQDKFAKNLASVKKEVGEVFSNLIQHTSTPEKTPNRENAEQINKEVSSSTVESLVTNEQQARRAADLAMEYVNKNPQILAQLSFLIKHNHELPPDQQKTLHDTLGKIKGDIDTIYNTIQQKIE